MFSGQLPRRVDSTTPWIEDGREVVSLFSSTPLSGADEVLRAAVVVGSPFRCTMRVQLNDARHVAIRPILPSDLDALRTFFAALSHATRRLRFHSSINELSERVLRKFTMVEHRAHVAFVAEIRDTAVDQPTTLVAEARYIRYADAESAEFALVVAEDWHRIGLVTSLTRILAQHARFARVRRLCGDVLEDNKAMRGFARSLGARLSRGIGCVQTVQLSLEALSRPLGTSHVKEFPQWR